MTGAVERPPGSCLREVLPSIVSPNVSADCGGGPLLDAGPFPRKFAPMLGHWGETFLPFEPRLLFLEEVEEIGSLKNPPGEGVGCCTVEVCRSVAPAVDGSCPSPPT